MPSPFSSSANQLNHKLAELRDQAPIVIRCANCDWTTNGPMLEASGRFQEHRLSAHGQPPGRKQRANKRTFVSAKTLAENLAGVRAAGSGVPRDEGAA